jgi:prevent-host-death family protein
MASRRHGPEIVIRDGRPAAVILDIDDYEKMLERLEDYEDLKALRLQRRRPLKFRKFADFLKEHAGRV